MLPSMRMRDSLSARMCARRIDIASMPAMLICRHIGDAKEFGTGFLEDLAHDQRALVLASLLRSLQSLQSVCPARRLMRICLDTDFSIQFGSFVKPTLGVC